MIASVAVLIALFGLGGYMFFSKTGPFTAFANTANKNESEKGAQSESANEQINKIASAVATGADANSNEPDADRDGVGNVISYTPKCRGVGCPTANPAYSIVTNKSITVTAGTSAGPFTASTSNGWAVNWSGPGCMIYTTKCPFGFGYGTGRETLATTHYYIRADQDVVPGSYTLVMSAIHSASETLVKTTLMVVVVPASSPAPSQTFSPPPQTPAPLPYPTMSSAPATPTPSPTYTPTP